MKGKYITTSIKLAVLSGTNKKINILEELPAATGHHKIIWSKDKQIKKIKFSGMKIY